MTTFFIPSQRGLRHRAFQSTVWFINCSSPRTRSQKCVLAGNMSFKRIKLTGIAKLKAGEEGQSVVVQRLLTHFPQSKQKILISIQSVFWFLLADLFSIWRTLVRVNWTWWLSKVPNIKHFEPIEAHLNHLHLIHVFEICTFVSLVVVRKGVGRNTILRAVRGNAIPDDKSNPIQLRYVS